MSENILWLIILLLSSVIMIGLMFTVGGLVSYKERLDKMLLWFDDKDNDVPMPPEEPLVDKQDFIDEMIALYPYKVGDKIRIETEGGDYHYTITEKDLANKGKFIKLPTEEPQSELERLTEKLDTLIPSSNPVFQNDLLEEIRNTAEKKAQLEEFVGKS